jgi:phosphoglycolate phosphatase
MTAIIFDLDGTLVDSSHGILASLAAAFDSNGYRPALPLSSALIGPPLRETLRLLCSEPDDKVLEQLSISFKDHYDTIGFGLTTPFPGVAEMLQALADAETPLHIATNKRHRPALQILQALGWSGLFDQVLSPDSFSPPLPGKAAILAQLLTEKNLSATDCLYIGDRIDDYQAANEMGIPFAFAVWGFEADDAVIHLDTVRLETPNTSQIMSIFSDRPSR